MATAIRLGDVWLPSSSAHTALLNFVEPLLHGYEEMPYTPYRFLGSSFKITQDERYFQLSTNHQRDRDELLSTYLISNNEYRSVSCEKILFPTDSEDSEQYLDYRLMEFTGSVKAGRLDSKRWYPLKRQYYWEEIVCCLALGYPFDENNIYDNPEKITFNCGVITGKFIGKTFSGLQGFTPISKPAHSLNGFSGGPVFFLVKNYDLFELVPAGLITNASHKQVNFIPARKFQLLIDKA